MPVLRQLELSHLNLALQLLGAWPSRGEAGDTHRGWISEASTFASKAGAGRFSCGCPRLFPLGFCIHRQCTRRKDTLSSGKEGTYSPGLKF